jgi:hypothetical protein
MPSTDSVQSLEADNLQCLPTPFPGGLHGAKVYEMHLFNCWLWRWFREENELEIKTFEIRIHLCTVVWPPCKDFSFALSALLYVKAPNLWSRDSKVPFKAICYELEHYETE